MRTQQVLVVVGAVSGNKQRAPACVCCSREHQHGNQMGMLVAWVLAAQEEMGSSCLLGTHCYYSSKEHRGLVCGIL